MPTTECSRLAVAGEQQVEVHTRGEQTGEDLKTWVHTYSQPAEAPSIAPELEGGLGLRQGWEYIQVPLPACEQECIHHSA